ncbi:ATPase [Aureibaculum sp. 2210JD6-5]|uniref:ATPase n=1 Tax=Aureibaculum sp. 2210JD6-5 TaxID=3103957 RepID=UPI002AAE8420|nr:ATPase [Aureibaculum sp. 2210JD6-5]MDY7396867.1 ATPase [Aureibaculum sp. 2210JD6-5]
MKNLKPHIITEGNVQYELGELKNNQVLYDFDKILNYVNTKGKLLFGEKFKIRTKNHNTIFKLCNYLIKDEANCKKLNIDVNKGILLSGSLDSGKRNLMELLQYLVPHHRSYELMPTRNITFAFNHTGYKTIEHFGNNNFYCFIDLGLEPMGNYYGNDCNVMGEIILSRYDLLLNHKIKTHATTILNAEELEGLYGSLVRKRMRRLFNLIVID